MPMAHLFYSGSASEDRGYGLVVCASAPFIPEFSFTAALGPIFGGVVHRENVSFARRMQEVHNYLTQGWRIGRSLKDLGEKSKRVWIKKNGVKKKINIELLDSYITQGWTRSTKFKHVVS
jgi:hypothetical protein